MANEHRDDAASLSGPNALAAGGWFVLLLTAALTMSCVESPPQSDAARVSVAAPIEGEPGQSHHSEAATPAVAPVAHKFTNALVNETSPYLLQHAHNPVNWYPWGEAAFKLAKEQNKSIFLSIGYSTCYWCHVMERESFENEEVAAILNEHFICIKVDREERPDIDEQYMLATQLYTGRGGWPNSLWLTPDGRPWMAGTYFPRDRFMEGLTRLAAAWKEQPELIDKQANSFRDAIKNTVDRQQQPGERALSRKLVSQSLEAMKSTFDDEHGGFGGKPKFPPHGDLRVLLSESERTGDPALLAMATKTLNAMWNGGIHDHLGGGFHRYATDDHWFLPHFEKMLYDNAQLMRAYTDAHVITSEPRYRAAVADIFRWLQREMTHSDGAFYSALDSGEVGQEGEFYVWTLTEIQQVLGDNDAQLFVTAYGLEPAGNFAEESTGEKPGTNILFLQQAPPASAAEDLARMRDKLLVVRNRRTFPHRDDKILASWNGLMISALAHAGKELEEPRYTDAAIAAAEFLVKNMLREGTLQRSWRAGEARAPGYLDDYAYVLDGLVELYLATDDKRWLAQACRLADTMLVEFEDSAAGGFYFTSDQHDDLLVRSKNLTGGGNLPSGNGVAAQALLQLGKITRNEKYTAAARRTLESLADLMARSPGSTETLILATSMLLDQSPAGKEPVDDQPAVSVELFSSRTNVQPGQTFQIAVKLKIEPGWHLYGPNPGVKFVVPTTLSLPNDEVGSLEKVMQPSGETKLDPVLMESVAIYSGEVWLRATIAVSQDASLGRTNFVLQLRTQACDETRCLEPRTATLQLPIEIVKQASTELRHPEVFKEE